MEFSYENLTTYSIRTFKIELFSVSLFSGRFVGTVAMSQRTKVVPMGHGRRRSRKCDGADQSRSQN